MDDGLAHMSQDKPVLSREMVEDMREMLHCYQDHYDEKHINALCDLALSALDRQGPASGSPDEGSIAQSGLERSPVKAEVAGSNPAGAATIEELIGRLEAAAAYVGKHDRHQGLMEEAAIALRELVQESARLRDSEAGAHELAGDYRELLTQHKDWLHEALDKWYHWMTIPFAQRSVVDAFNDQERIAKIRKLMEGE